MPDYEEALASDSNKSKYIGKISNGEKVMAVCRIIKDSNGDNVGAIRVLSSLEQIDRQVATLTLLVFIGLVIVFALIIFSNLFFITVTEFQYILRRSSYRYSHVAWSRYHVTVNSYTL